MRHLFFLGIPLALTLGCGDRPEIWDAPPSQSKTRVVGLENGVALIDDDAQRAVMLLPKPDQELDRVSLPIGRNVLRVEASPDRKRLFVLSSGVFPRLSERDEKPSLTVIDATTHTFTATRFDLAAPRSGLAIDPLGRWVAVFAAADAMTTFVENPNELVLFDLTAPPSENNPITTTVRSFGGKPQRVTFAPTLTLPEGPRRLLVVETEQDVSLLDLDHLRDRPEITVRLTSGGDTRVVRPGGVTFHDGDPARSDDARIGVRLVNDTNVITLELAPPVKPGSPHDFAPKINLTDVGGVASDIAFVTTDGGLRLAALVPSLSSAVLVDTETSITTRVSLPAAYSRMSLVTDVIAGGGTDTAMLWNAPSVTSGVAFWALGKATAQPYRSVEVLSLGSPVAGVRDVPRPRPELKVLETGGRGLFVLDLASRTVAPLTTLGAATVTIAPNAERMWAFQQGERKLASVDLDKLHPVPLVIERPIQSVHDVARPGGGRSLVAIHAEGTFGATVFDARNADTAFSRLHAGLLLEGL